MTRQQLMAEIVADMANMRRWFVGAHATSVPAKGSPTRAQIGIMYILAHAGPMTLKELAERMCMSSSAGTQLVDGLVRSKLLRRTEDPKDRRKTYLSLADAGKKKLKEMHKVHLAYSTKLFTVLDDKELLAWRDLQRKITSQLRNV